MATSPSLSPFALMSRRSAWQYGHQSAAKNSTVGCFAASASAASRVVKITFVPLLGRVTQLVTHLRVGLHGVG